MSNRYVYEDSIYQFDTPEEAISFLKYYILEEKIDRVLSVFVTNTNRRLSEIELKIWLK